MTARVKVETRPDGTVTVAVTGDIPEALEQRLSAAMKPERREALRASVHRHHMLQNSISPAERGETFAVPRLFLNVQGELQLAEEELILDLGGWTLNDCSARAVPGEFAIRKPPNDGEVDLYGEKVGYKHLDQNIQLEIDSSWTGQTYSFPGGWTGNAANPTSPSRCCWNFAAGLFISRGDAPPGT